MNKFAITVATLAFVLAASSTQAFELKMGGEPVTSVPTTQYGKCQVKDYGEGIFYLSTSVYGCHTEDEIGLALADFRKKNRKSFNLTSRVRGGAMETETRGFFIITEK